MTRSQLTMLAARLLLAGLAFTGDFAIQGFDPSPRAHTGQIVLFVILSLLAGALIARWWAMLIALACLFVAATIPTGGEDAGGAVEVISAVGIGLAQALLIALGASAAKLVRTWRRRGRNDTRRCDPALASAHR